LQTPNKPVPTPPAPRLLPPDDHIKQVQQRLIELGFLGGDADGRLGPATHNGILAFQKWERLQRTAALDARTGDPESPLRRCSCRREATTWRRSARWCVRC
jgi:peptidoglycan hydrolase-like protein with peptidoglycan-binding domain